MEKCCYGYYIKPGKTPLFFLSPHLSVPIPGQRTHNPHKITEIINNCVIQYHLYLLFKTDRYYELVIIIAKVGGVILFKN